MWFSRPMAIGQRIEIQSDEEDSEYTAVRFVMGFGADMQGKPSHEALLRIQDSEIKLLENIRRCMQIRVENDRKYSAGLHQFVLQAQKINPDPSQEFTSLCTLFKVWDVLIRETQQLSQLFANSAEELSTKTLEKLNSLLIEKRLSRKLYSDERNRLEADFSKLQEDLGRCKAEYHKVMERLKLDKSKYEEIYRRPGKNVKLEDAKAKYLKTTVKLHKIHNDYVIALREVTAHQDEYLGKNLPSFLDYHQSTQHILVEQCKDILLDYSRLTNLGSPSYQDVYSQVQESVQEIKPEEEYNNFMNQYRSESLTSLPFEFEEKFLDDYQGALQVNQIACDDLTLEALKHRRVTLEDSIKVLKSQHSEKEKELNIIVQELDDVKNRLIQEEDERVKNDYFVKRRAMEILKRELAEKDSEIKKLQLLYDVLDNPLNELGDKTPPPGLEFMDTNGEQDLSTSSSGSSGLAVIKDKIFRGLRKTSAPNLNPLPHKEDLHLKKSGSQVQLPGSYDPVGKATNGIGGPQFTIMQDGFVPKSLDDEQWFHGILPREEVIRLLQRDGDFLVRESKNRKTNETQYVLSVFWGVPKHFIIQNCEGGWRFEGQIFPTMSELIHFQLMSGEPVTSKSQAILSNAILREDWELLNDDIELEQKIGNGNFGEVFKGLFKPRQLTVAVKTCRDTLKDDQKKKFLGEGRILKQYNHPNIVEFIGIAAQRQPVMIVMEYCSGGALLNFLRKQGKSESKKTLAQMCQDASSGMTYLEEKGCIHRDLAARNCLIAKQNVVKISDFGMSREEELYTVSEGMKQIPIKWTAPEALNFGKYTSLCDVWSYGVLMWEVFSCGTTPYSGMSNAIAREKVEKGYRMPTPEGTPDKIYQLMLKCWEYEPDRRPHFKDIYQELGKIIPSL